VTDSGRLIGRMDSEEEGINKDELFRLDEATIKKVLARMDLR
jgi:hypothetical protein